MKHAKPDSKEILILIGSGRSGTTYFSRMLKMALGFGFTAEPKFVVRFYQNLKRYGDLGQAENLHRLCADLARLPVFAHLKKVVGAETRAEDLVARVEYPTYEFVLYAVFDYFREKRGQHLLAYKDPLDTKYVALLASLLPKAKFIHLYRDPRNVALSTTTMNWGATNVYVGAKEWAYFTGKGMQEGRALPKDRYLEVKYEDLVLDYPSVVAEVVQFLFPHADNAAREKRLLDMIEASKSEKALDRWKTELSPEQIRVVEGVCGRTMQALGYDLHLDQARVHAWEPPYYRMSDLLFRSLNRLRRREL